MLDFWLSDPLRTGEIPEVTSVFGMNHETKVFWLQRTPKGNTTLWMQQAQNLIKEGWTYLSYGF